MNSNFAAKIADRCAFDSLPPCKQISLRSPNIAYFHCYRQVTKFLIVFCFEFQKFLSFEQNGQLLDQIISSSWKVLPFYVVCILCKTINLLKTILFKINILTIRTISTIDLFHLLKSWNFWNQLITGIRFQGFPFLLEFLPEPRKWKKNLLTKDLKNLNEEIFRHWIRQIFAKWFL